MLVHERRRLQLERHRLVHRANVGLPVRLRVGVELHGRVRRLVQHRVRRAEQLHGHRRRQLEPRVQEPSDVRAHVRRIGERDVRLVESLHRQRRSRLDDHVRVRRDVRRDVYGDLHGGEPRWDAHGEVQVRCSEQAGGRFGAVPVTVTQRSPAISLAPAGRPISFRGIFAIMRCFLPFAVCASIALLTPGCGGSSFTTADDAGSSDASTADASTAGDGSSDASKSDSGIATDGGGIGIEAGTCKADAGIFNDVIKGCTVDIACVVVLHQIDCCGSKVAIGINHASKDAFTQDETTWESSCPACGCPPAPTVAEDGKPCDLTTCKVSCDNGQCRTSGP